MITIQRSITVPTALSDLDYLCIYVKSIDYSRCRLYVIHNTLPQKKRFLEGRRTNSQKQEKGDQKNNWIGGGGDCRWLGSTQQKTTLSNSVYTYWYSKSSVYINQAYQHLFRVSFLLSEKDLLMNTDLINLHLPLGANYY